MKAPEPFRILLVCSGNTCRSSMAEAILRHTLARLWPAGLPPVEVSSAGTMAFPGAPASEHAVAALHEMGLDLSGHRARQATPELMQQASLILTMTRGHKAQVERLLAEASPQVFTLLEYAYDGEPQAQADVQDPFGASLETYRATATALAVALERVVQRLRRDLAGPADSAPQGDTEGQL